MTKKVKTKKLTSAKTNRSLDKASGTPSKMKKKTATQATSKSTTVKLKTQKKVKARVTAKLSKRQSVKDLLSKQSNNFVPDLNASTNHPIHPNRIWPD